MGDETQPCSGVSMRREPPDLFLLFLSGVVGEKEARLINAEIERFSEGTTGVFVLADVTAMSSLSADVRKATTETAPLSCIAGIAVIGASFHSRVLLTLIIKTITVFRGYSPPFHYFSTEADARAWIADVRQAQRDKR